ncbi:MAG: 4-hydroxythreonine-4-phosphate dehydrogenase PdxA [Acetobacteraceae bacterium]|nr:4-hydroxythreonine-4-phosphate dehydrogenase PdxA [Acetobacteraceae bacterium]
MSARPAIGIAIGDPCGIGPEIALKAALSPEVRAACRPVLVGDPAVIAAQAEAARIPVRLVEGDAGEEEVAVLPAGILPPGHFRFGAADAETGRAALGSAAAAIRAALEGRLHAVVAAPQNQAAIAAAGIAFDGYPGFLAQQTGLPPEDVFLMLCFDATRIVHLTLHVPVRRALELITGERVLRALRAADAALRRMGVARPRLAVGGINPHAGEGGLFGTEDREILAPAIAAARAEGLDASGPFGADTLFHRKGYDAFLVMFHDQGHIAAKMVAAHRTAGVAIGSPVLFSSVAHGTGHDIAGRGQGNPAAMIEAVLRLAGPR